MSLEDHKKLNQLLASTLDILENVQEDAAAPISQLEEAHSLADQAKAFASSDTDQTSHYYRKNILQAVAQVVTLFEARESLQEKVKKAFESAKQTHGAKKPQRSRRNRSAENHEIVRAVAWTLHASANDIALVNGALPKGDLTFQAVKTEILRMPSIGEVGLIQRALKPFSIVGLEFKR